jgi:hypothetical protein
VFANRVLRNIFGTNVEEVIGGWGRLHEELHDSYSQILVTKSRTMKHA